MAIASTSPEPPAGDAAAAPEAPAPSPRPGDARAGALTRRRARSLTQRMILLAAAWIIPLLALGGFALDRVLTDAITRNFDGQLDFALDAMIAAADIGPAGEVRLTRKLGDQRFEEPYSGLYWQISSTGADPFVSRSLWDRTLVPDLKRDCREPCRIDYAGFKSEPLRLVERTVVLPGSTTRFHFQVAQSTGDLDAQVGSLRSVLLWSLSVLGLGLLALAALQSIYGLWPLRRVSAAIAAIRSGAATRVDDDFPREITPLVTELNDLLAHNESQAEAARRHAGNLAHALKTPMSVLLGEARAGASDLAASVAAQTAIMRRHVDHHLARARATGRRAASASRAEIWPSVTALARTIARIHAARGTVIDVDGAQNLCFRGEKQDLEEMVGNLIDNAALYGGGRVFVTVSADGDMARILVEDDGPGIPLAERERLFERGARLDTAQPGTGLGLSIVRDVAEIYGGAVALGESEDLGGLAATLTLPSAG